MGRKYHMIIRSFHTNFWHYLMQTNETQRERERDEKVSFAWECMLYVVMNDKIYSHCSRLSELSEVGRTDSRCCAMMMKESYDLLIVHKFLSVSKTEGNGSFWLFSFWAYWSRERVSKLLNLCKLDSTLNFGNFFID